MTRRKEAFTDPARSAELMRQYAAADALPGGKVLPEPVRRGPADAAVDMVAGPGYILPRAVVVGPIRDADGDPMYLAMLSATAVPTMAHSVRLDLRRQEGGRNTSSTNLYLTPDQARALASDLTRAAADARDDVAPEYTVQRLPGRREGWAVFNSATGATVAGTRSTTRREAREAAAELGLPLTR